ncbi:hypothetical protein EPI10_005345 [Gossypium australe]|uniref:Uncharacterized protein n=1 Tax=Gossypium australe TaxID=47621 RepID=A0A5B6WQQ9_9ROSI|nr:hypothetical protein EPI10_005345 [Gossypium australe]
MLSSFPSDRIWATIWYLIALIRIKTCDFVAISFILIFAIYMLKILQFQSYSLGFSLYLERQKCPRLCSGIDSRRGLPRLIFKAFDEFEQLATE